MAHYPARTVGILILQTHLATPHQKITVNLPEKAHNQHDYVIIPALFLVRRKIPFFFHTLTCWHKAGHPSSPCMPHTRSIVQLWDPQDTGATMETMGSWGVDAGGRWECLHQRRRDPQGQWQSARLHLCSLSCLPSSHNFRLGSSNHLCTSTAHQMSYGKYLE